MKKGQVEIMGLVIVVILLVFISIFALGFIIKPRENNIDDVLKLKANSLRSSLLKTTLCGNVNVQDEIENCIDNYHECLDCNVLKDEISKMIERSIEPGENYNLVISIDEQTTFISINNCSESINSVSQTLRNGKVEIGLCRR